MRALWSQIPRPRLGGPSSLSANDPAVAILVRKTTTAPLKRRLTFNDAFTLLLTPVLATAFVVDTSWKEKQRRDWDKKLAEIQDEIDQFHARELRILSSLPVQSVSRTFLQQRRQYSVLADPQILEEQDEGAEDEGYVEAPQWSLDSLSSTHEDMSVGEMLSTYEQQSLDFTSEFESDEDASSSGPAKSYQDQELSAGHRYHRLIATMLAIRLITHFHVSTTARLIPDEDESTVRPGTKHLPNINDIVGLVAMNHKVREELKDLRRASLDLYGLGCRMQQIYHGSSLNQQLLALVEDFKQQKLDSFEFVKGYGSLILNSDQVPCTETYVKILGALGRAGNQSLAYYVNSALKNSLLPLNDSAVGHMLYHYGHSRDTQQADMFLRRVVQSGSPYNLVTKWQFYETSNGTIPVPENLNPHILQLLVYMALRSNQPERAETWYSFLKEVNYTSRAVAHLFSSFLYHYALVQQWEKGFAWVQKGIANAIEIGSTSLPGLSQIIFRMLDLCVACRRHAEYATIIDAAVCAGIPPPAVSPARQKRYTPRAQSILLEWEAFAAGKQTPEHILSRDRAMMFQQKCNFDQASQKTTTSDTNQAPDPVKPKEGSDLSNVTEQELLSMSETQKQLEMHSFEFHVTKARAASQLKSMNLLKRKQALLFDRLNEMPHELSLVTSLQAEIAILREEIALMREPPIPQIPSPDESLRAELASLKAEIARLTEPPTPKTPSPDEAILAELAALKAEIAWSRDSTRRISTQNEKRLAESSPKPDGSKPPTLQQRVTSSNQNREGRIMKQRSQRRRMAIESSVETSLEQDTPRNPSTATGNPPNHSSDASPGSSLEEANLQKPGARSKRNPSNPRPGKKYRLDLSNIGHAIPDIKDAAPVSKAGSYEDDTDIDNHVVIRRYYESD